MQIQDREQSHASIKVVGLTQTYATRPKGNVGSCKPVLVSRLSEDS